MKKQFILKKTDISISSDVPLYLQLIEVVKAGISDGLLLEGDLVPSEKELCEIYEISRSTVRQAIGLLEKEGYVKRRRGLGTFVTKPKMERHINAAYSFSKDMKVMGFTPTSKIIEFEVLEVDTELDLIFNLPEYDRELYKIVRVRCADGEALLLETTYIPSYINNRITKERLLTESLYDILSIESGISPYNAEESYEATLIDQTVAKLLECGVGECGFYIQRITEDQQGRVYELTRSIARGDRTKFVISMHGDAVELNRNFNYIDN